ncbi:MAG: transposase, partial [Thermodesulfobacteriota bacterium]
MVFVALSANTRPHFTTIANFISSMDKATIHIFKKRGQICCWLLRRCMLWLLIMSRPLRIEYPGAWYHVMNRGRRRENIFLNPRDYETFIKVLHEADEGWNIKISAYCLMSNHYHLLVHTPDGNISRCMRHINGVYTQRFNRDYKKDGQLFRGRYKAVLVDADSHLLEVLRYIHRNPLRADLAMGVKDYPWTSHQGYMSNAKKWAWLHKDILLSMLCEKKRGQKAAYMDFVSQVESEEIERFYSLKNLPSVLGRDSFKEWIKAKFNHLSFHKEIPESRNLAPTVDEVILAVCEHFKVKKEEIAVSKRGIENLPRDAAIYLVRRNCRETLARIGRHFSISNYSTVSSAIERIKTRKNKDRTLQKQLDIIRAKTQQKPTADSSLR